MRGRAGGVQRQGAADRAERRRLIAAELAHDEAADGERGGVVDPGVDRASRMGERRGLVGRVEAALQKQNLPAPGQDRVRERIVRIELERVFEEARRDPRALRPDMGHVRQRSQTQVVGVEAFGRFRRARSISERCSARLDHADDAVGDLVL